MGIHRVLRRPPNGLVTRFRATTLMKTQGDGPQPIFSLASMLLRSLESWFAEAAGIEASSSRPPAAVIRNYWHAIPHAASSVEETPGQGPKAISKNADCSATIGNEAGMQDDTVESWFLTCNPRSWPLYDLRRTKSIPVAPGECPKEAAIEAQ
ncbi:hypothetical protein BJV78DRAFT_1353299 [Lactifluus subvellereus]|nr:hypothetical protein BJV78DRAFT_1353299 [Lactifluus subvellereus]